MSRSGPGQTATANAQFATSNCGALPFTPELSARVKRVGAVNDPIELSTTIAQTIEEAGLRRAQVVLPAGIGGNNDVLSNQCSQADFLAETCPAASLVGFASATSPLLSEGLIGQVALVQPGAPGLPDIGIDLRGPLALKLKGTLGFTPEGRNIVVFDNLPDIPIAEFTLTFGGDRRSACGRGSDPGRSRPTRGCAAAPTRSSRSRSATPRASGPSSPSAAARRAGSAQPARIAPGPASIPVEG